MVCVVGTVGLLIALLLRSVQAARAAARRIQCRNNLKQLGVALHNYHGSFGQFPRGTVCKNQFGEGIYRTSGWPYFIVNLLPFMEQESLFDMLSLAQQANLPLSASDGLADSWPAEIDNASVSTLLCPSDGFGGASLNQGQLIAATNGDSTGGPNLFKSNYLGIFSGGDMQDVAFASGSSGLYTPGSPSHPGFQCVFDINRGSKIRDITDGTSQTLMLAEYLTGTDKDMRGVFWQIQAGYSNIFAWSTPNSSGPDILCGWCTPKANQPEMNLPCVAHERLYGRTATSRSRHPGGVNIILADGSVHFISETIDVDAWRAMGTIDRGEVLRLP